MAQGSFHIYDAEPARFPGDVLILILPEAGRGKTCAGSRVLATALEHLRDRGDFPPREGQLPCLYPALLDWKNESPFKAGRILLCSVDTDDAGEDVLRERLRLCGGAIARELRRMAAQTVLLLPLLSLPLALEESLQELVEGLVLGSYAFQGYKREEKDAARPGVRRFDLVLPSVDAQTAKRLCRSINQAQAVARAVCLARDMGNQPANRWTPADFAAHAEALGTKRKLHTTVLGPAEMQALGMEAILAVSRGSALPPTLSVIEYRTGKRHPTVLLVGKGLTFDSGGISAKPPAGMEDMKFDMCGGAAVMAVLQSLADLGIGGINVVGLVPATENLSGSAAVKPGDVVRHYGGLHAEVVNTDAEGRLILGDAMAYGIATYAPDAVIDIATLTGAAVVGLGHHYSCLLANDDRLAERLLRAGEACGEPLWRLPLGREYRRQLDSTVADIKNAGERSGATITAACYLQEFVGSTAWAHLDIAGTAWNFTEKSYVPKGASGVGVRTLLRVLQGWNRPRAF